MGGMVSFAYNYIREFKGRKSSRDISGSDLSHLLVKTVTSKYPTPMPSMINPSRY
jgi:hypothetical protein